jgi:fumarylpyruvate hydrolase
MPFDVPRVTVPITDGGTFPVRRIYCVGQNYRAHALEMGSDPDRQLPFFFTKPADAVVPSGATIPYPPMTEAFEHEIELVVALGDSGADVSAADAPRLIFGYAVGLDMTRRDLQATARKAGRPWDMSKGFDHSAPIGPISPVATVGDLREGAIWLAVNNAIRQSSNISQLIWNVPEVIAELSRYVTLKPGDLIFTGTPENVGKVHPGDTLHGHVDGLSDVRVTIGPR